VTKDNFNSIKIKPVKDPGEHLSRTMTQAQKVPKQNIYQPKKTLTNIDLFRKRKRGLQTLSTINSPATEEITSILGYPDPVCVDFISADLKGPIMPSAFYSSKLSMARRYKSKRWCQAPGVTFGNVTLSS